MASWLKKNWPVVAVAVVAIGGAVVLYSRSAAASQAPATLPAPAAVTVAPGLSTIMPAKGATVVFNLPAGAKWQFFTVEGQPLSVGNSTGPVSQSFASSVRVIATWTDAAGAAQTATINVNPS